MWSALSPWRLCLDHVSVLSEAGHRGKKRTEAGCSGARSIKPLAGALLPLPTLLPTTDPYDQFLAALRASLIKLAGYGYVVEQFAISPHMDGQRLGPMPTPYRPLLTLGVNSL